MDRCPKCGQEPKPRHRFCVKCRTPLGERRGVEVRIGPPTYQLPAAVGSRRTIKQLLIGGVLAVALVYGLCGLLNWVFPHPPIPVDMRPPAAPPATPQAETVLEIGQAWRQGGLVLTLAGWDGDGTLTFVLENQSGGPVSLRQMRPRLVGVPPDGVSSGSQVRMQVGQLDGRLANGESVSFGVQLDPANQTWREWSQVLVRVEELGRIRGAQWRLPVPGTVMAPPGGRVTTSRLNVRTGPGMQYEVVDQLSAGGDFQVLARWCNPGEGSDWLLIGHGADGGQRWVSGSSRYVAVGNAEGLACVTAPPTPTVAPEELEFRAERSRLRAGECTTLRWRLQGVQAAVLEGETVPTEGAKEVCPQATQRYTLVVLREDGRQLERTTTVVVTGTPEAGADPNFWADRTHIAPGECTTLRWNFEGIDTVVVNGGRHTGRGSELVCLTETRVYTLTVVERDGRFVDHRLTITVSGAAAGPIFAVEHSGCIGGLPQERSQVKGQVFDRHGRIIVGVVLEVTVNNLANVVPPAPTNRDGWYEWNLTPGQTIQFVSLQVDGQLVAFTPPFFAVPSVGGCYQRVDFRER